MQRLFAFIQHNFHIMLFVVLQIICGFLIFSLNPYQQATFSKLALGITSSINKLSSNVYSYWDLKNQNSWLQDQISEQFRESYPQSFIYLNDTFEGGYLNFKNHDVKIHPKPGMIAIFAGGYTNEHEVTKVHNGTRYTIGSFWDNADATYTEEQVKEREERLKKTRAEQDLTYKQWAEEKEKGIIQEYIGKNGER